MWPSFRALQWYLLRHITLDFDVAIIFLGVYPADTFAMENDLRARFFNVVLLVFANKWKRVPMDFNRRLTKLCHPNNGWDAILSSPK